MTRNHYQVNLVTNVVGNYSQFRMIIPKNGIGLAQMYLLLIVLMMGFSSPRCLSAASLNGFDLSNTLIPAGEIYHGGPPRDGIPSIDQPHFVAADDAGFVKPLDRVLGLQRQGIAKAYPVQILNHHEIVNDRLGTEAILVSFCPLCGSGMAFLAATDSRAREFGVSGLLYNSDMLLYDRETQSLWSQMKAQAISGPERGAQLSQIVLEHTSWQDWRSRHPDTLVLSIDTGYSRDYTRSPYAGYEKSTETYFPVSTLDRRYHAKEQVIGLQLDGVSKAYPFAELSRTSGELEDDVAGQTVTIRFDAANRAGGVFTQGGQQLPSTISYWFAWVAFHPETEVYQAP
jgi:hypothetical protein